MRKSDAAAMAGHVGLRFTPAARSKIPAVSFLEKCSDPELHEKCALTPNLLTPNLVFAPQSAFPFHFY
jgi:hypothetical protein